MKEIIYSSKVPEPIGPYSQAVKFGDMLFFSGQIAINPETGELVMDTIENETHQVMKNISSLLKESGSDLSKIIKSSIFLSDMGLFQEINKIYGSYFDGNYPARETVEVAMLPKGVNVEISVIAHI